MPVASMRHGNTMGGGTQYPSFLLFLLARERGTNVPGTLPLPPLRMHLSPNPATLPQGSGILSEPITASREFDD